jgi:hypothetical protein
MRHSFSLVLMNRSLRRARVLAFIPVEENAAGLFEIAALKP